MKCPECVKLGQRSIVYPGVSSATLVYFQPFCDEDGKLHHHNGNVTTTDYSCSLGHKWFNKQEHSCWCGWPYEAKS